MDMSRVRSLRSLGSQSKVRMGRQCLAAWLPKPPEAIEIGSAILRDLRFCSFFFLLFYFFHFVSCSLFFLSILGHQLLVSYVLTHLLSWPAHRPPELLLIV